MQLPTAKTVEDDQELMRGKTAGMVAWPKLTAINHLDDRILTL